jgi:hypothetical protein
VSVGSEPDYELDADDIAKNRHAGYRYGRYFSHRDPSVVKRMSERKLDS